MQDDIDLNNKKIAQAIANEHGIQWLPKILEIFEKYDKEIDANKTMCINCK